jgi:signal transduction histidine kinase
VNQVLDMAKIESGSAEWRSTDVDLGALVEQAALTTRELFRERGAVLEVERPAQVRTLRADADRLLQVLLNLLTNAAKFVPAGSGRVQLRLREHAAGLTVEVQDNGPGVPAAQQQLVFEKFRQGGDAAHRPQGTGLGLPISRRIVEHFGGRLWLRSEPGQGACFGFELPWHGPQETPS